MFTGNWEGKRESLFGMRGRRRVRRRRRRRKGHGQVSQGGYSASVS